MTKTTTDGTRTIQLEETTSEIEWTAIECFRAWFRESHVVLEAAARATTKKASATFSLAYKRDEESDLVEITFAGKQSVPWAGGTATARLEPTQMVLL